MESEPQIALKKTHCVRCGECCLAAGPTLQKTDLPLFFDRILKRTQLYTIRKGELVHDNINAGLKFSDREMIKLKGPSTGKGCILYDSNKKACTIYAHRPSQCRAFACWDDVEFKKVFAEPKATRKNIIRDPNLLRLMEAHENKCDYQVLSDYVKRIRQKGDSIVSALLKSLQYDQEIRQLSHEKLGIGPGELDLLYGRPLAETILMFGLKVKQENNGSFLLTTEDAR